MTFFTVMQVFMLKEISGVFLWQVKISSDKSVFILIPLLIIVKHRRCHQVTHF